MHRGCAGWSEKVMLGRETLTAAGRLPWRHRCTLLCGLGRSQTAAEMMSIHTWQQLSATTSSAPHYRDTGLCFASAPELEEKRAPSVRERRSGEKRRSGAKQKNCLFVNQLSLSLSLSPGPGLIVSGFTRVFVVCPPFFLITNCVSLNIYLTHSLGC